MHKLSVTIITKNEEKNIARCLNSVAWTDEIIVVDTGSTDRTIEICKNYNCQIFKTDWKGFGPAKKLAVYYATYDWILSIDADEEVTEALKIQIQHILQNPQYNGYKIKRAAFYLGKLIRHCGWNRDYPLRLFNRNFGNFNENIVHESVKIEGPIGKIEQSFLHDTYPTIQLHIAKMNDYAALGARQLFDKGKSSSIMGSIIRGVFKFLKMYLFQAGFLDGKTGLVLSYNSAFGVYLKYLKLWEMKR